MSIISDALKKAQEERNKNGNSTPTVNLPLKEPVTQDKKDNKILKILVIVLILAAFSAVGVVKFGKITDPKKQKHLDRKTNQIVITPETAVKTPEAQTEPAAQPQEELRLELTGILFDSASPLAIINGFMVRRGDRISDAEIVEIEPQRVKLNYRGKELYINLP